MLMCETNLNSVSPYSNIPYIKKFDPIWYDGRAPKTMGQVITVANRRISLESDTPTTNVLKIRK